MNDDKWEQLKEALSSKFTSAVVFREPLVEHGEERGIKEVVEFDGPSGKIRVERHSKPKVLDKSFHYSHRPGDTARVDYILSDSEFTHTLKVFREVDTEYEEIDIADLGL